MVAAAASASARRRRASGGPCIAWWPARPSVRLTSRTTWPRADHLAAVPPALMSASSGWAPTIRIRNGSSAMAASCTLEGRGDVPDRVSAEQGVDLAPDDQGVGAPELVVDDRLGRDAEEVVHGGDQVDRVVRVS